MKAIVYERYGPPEVLHLVEVEKPVPRNDEVLIRVHASTVTAADFRCRSFTVPRSFWIPARLALGILKPRQPILGAELSGEIEETGKDVTKFKKGDQIFAATIGEVRRLRRVHVPPRDRRDRPEADQHDLRRSRGRPDRSPRGAPFSQEGEYQERPEECLSTGPRAAWAPSPCSWPNTTERKSPAYAAARISNW